MLFQFGLVLGDAVVQDQMIGDVVNGVAKLFFLLAFGIYMLFAFIATRQIAIMRKTLDTPFSPMIQLLGYIHLLLAVLIFFFFLFL